MARKGLGKGLDSLIPNFYDEDFDSNSPQSLEDMLKGDEGPAEEEVEPQKEEQKNIFEEIQEEEAQKEDNEPEEVQEEEAQKEDNGSEEVQEEEVVEEPVPEEIPEEVKIQNEHVAEVKEIVDKNPRITLWSSRSSAVFRYLRKTEPEFSISKEASLLIEEAVSKKYPEIWELFDDY